MEISGKCSRLVTKIQHNLYTFIFKKDTHNTHDLETMCKNGRLFNILNVMISPNMIQLLLCQNK